MTHQVSIGIMYLLGNASAVPQFEHICPCPREFGMHGPLVLQVSRNNQMIMVHDLLRDHVFPGESSYGRRVHLKDDDWPNCKPTGRIKVPSIAKLLFPLNGSAAWLLN